MADSGRLRIGELSRRVGESPEVLRAWENRYGIVQPERSAGGLRLYSEEDERRVQVMRHHIAAGLSASEAARLAKLPPGRSSQPGFGPELKDIEAALDRSLNALDEVGAQSALDRLFVGFGLDSALSEVVLPFLHRLGARWAAAQMSVAQEHFVSNIIGGRLRGLSRGWGQGVGPRVILACPSGEQHELGLVSFGLALRQRGWRITYLGADTPLGDVVEMVDELAPAIVVLSAVSSQRFLDARQDVHRLVERVRVGIGGAGATQRVADALGVELLRGDLVEAAESLVP